jgi:hypothetical protein
MAILIPLDYSMNLSCLVQFQLLIEEVLVLISSSMSDI